MSLDLDAYLARIALPARPTLDEYGLAAMQRAQRLAIPFENLDIPLGRGVRIDSDSVFAKLVTGKRGGYCFEQNRLQRDALTALGFAVRPLLGRVWLGRAESEPPPPLTHTLNLVVLDGQDWIADAGFGSSYAPPLPLIDGAEADSPDGVHHRLTRDGDQWTLWRDGASLDNRSSREPGWERQYSFTTGDVADDGLAAANAYTSTTPGTRFTTLKIASIALPTGFAALTDRHYRRRNGTDATESTITDPRVYRLRLSLVFGIDLAPEESRMLWGEP